MKKYMVLLLSAVFLVSCHEDNAKEIDVDNLQKNIKENIQQKEYKDSYLKFFETEEYENSDKAKKCIDDSNGDFNKLTLCSNDSIKIIKAEIKKKLRKLNKSEKILDEGYEKIKANCTKEIVEDEDFEGEDDTTKNSFIASCIKIDLYQFGRDLK